MLCKLLFSILIVLHSSQAQYIQEEEDDWQNPTFGELYPDSLEEEFYPQEINEDRPSRQAEICSNQKEIQRSLHALKCQPVTKIIKLKSVGPNFDLVPSVAQVKRCAGHCHAPFSCLPNQKRNIQIEVFRFDRANASASASCVLFELQQHESCHCDCSIKSHHCTTHQFYDRSNCACVCKDQDLKHECLYSVSDSQIFRRVWDEGRCKCKCEPLRACEPPTVWAPGNCRCVRMPDEEENDNVIY